jgi:hypothetical protein
MLLNSDLGLIKNSTGTNYSSPGFYNPLHDYSSYNYVITLAAITKDQSTSRTFFHSNPKLEYIILKSSGKGTSGINLSSAVSYGQGTVTSESAANANNWGSADTTGKAEFGPSQEDKELAGILTEFNASGTGRFDFFVESLNMNGPTGLVIGATVMQLDMTVIEPLSMNSFLESVRINCLAAGWENHNGAHFCLKIEFWGWNNQTGKAEQVPRSTRYFHVTMSSSNISVDERGTVHRLGFTNQNAIGYGLDGETPTTVKMVGDTVKEILTNFMQTITEESKKANGSENPDVYNTYDIEFLPWTSPAPGGEAFNGKHPGSDDCKINPDRLRSNQSFEFSAPTSKTLKNNYKFVNSNGTAPAKPDNETITVKSGSKIAQIVEAVVRDSEYTRWFIDNKESLKTKYNGLVPWFRVTVRAEIKPKRNPKENRNAYTFFYQVRPYWVHFSKLPEEFGTWEPSEILRTVSRQYNYFYSGKNVDIIDFQLTIDNLYFMPRPYKLGDQDRSGTSLAAAPSNTQKLEAADQPKTPTDSPQNVPPAKAGTVADVPIYGSTKGMQISPYQAIAASIHSQLVRNPALTAMNVKIIGDPYYLVSIGYGNSDSEDQSSSQNKNGEAPWLDKAIYIAIDFKSPRDYREDGFMDFGQDKIDHYSGIFQVNNVSCTFRDGEFIQTLEMNRLPGQQPFKQPVKAIPFKQTPKAGEQTTKNTAPASVTNFGINKVQTDLTKLLNPKIPSFGIPGLLSSVTGLANAATNTLQSSVKRIDAAVQEGLGIIAGVVVPVERLLLSPFGQIGGIVAIADALLNGHSNNDQIGQSISGYDPYANGVPLQTTTIPSPSDTAQSQANKAAQARIISSFVQDRANLNTIESNYANNVITAGGRNYVTNPSDQNNLNNVGQRTLAALNGTPTDPSAIAAQLGIDPAQFSGLSADQQSSLLAQLQNIFSKVPTDASIQGYQALGLSLKNITGAGIANLPALQALTTPPLANISQYDLQKILASGGSVANLPGAASFASIGALLALLSSKPSNGSSGGNPLDQQQQIDKFDSAQALSNASLNTPGLDLALNGLGSVESNRANSIRTIRGYSGYYVETKTVTSLYGTQRELSPLDKLMLTKK